MARMYERLWGRKVGEVLSDTPVVLVLGLRRAGMVALVRKNEGTDRSQITLDDPSKTVASLTVQGGDTRGDLLYDWLLHCEKQTV